MSRTVMRRPRMHGSRALARLDRDPLYHGVRITGGLSSHPMKHRGGFCVLLDYDREVGYGFGYMTTLIGINSSARSGASDAERSWPGRKRNVSDCGGVLTNSQFGRRRRVFEAPCSPPRRLGIRP